MDWKIHKKDIVYDGHFKVIKYQISHQRFDGKTTPLLQRELVQRADAVAMIAYDPETDQLVLIKQFRIGAIRESQPWLVEVVAGLMQAGELPEEVARRESQEEIGCLPAELIKIGEFYTTPGGPSEGVHLYIGKVSVRDINQNGGLEHEGEDIKVMPVPASDVPFMLSAGAVRSAIAITGLQWLVINKENIRQRWLDH